MPTLCVDDCFDVHTVTPVENAIKALYQVSRYVLLLGMFFKLKTRIRVLLLLFLLFLQSVHLFKLMQ